MTPSEIFDMLSEADLGQDALLIILVTLLVYESRKLDKIYDLLKKQYKSKKSRRKK